jgi:hypothetical protein
MFSAEYAKIDPIVDPIMREAGGKR